jgi:hypothetical protein
MRKLSADFLCVVSFLLIITACASLGSAQQFSDRQKNDSTGEGVSGAMQTDAGFDSKNELAVWGGFAPDIPRVFGGSRKSSFGIVGFRYSRRIATTENLAFKYQFDLIPLAIINYRRERLMTATPTVYDRERETAYAAGLTPVSFQLNFRRKSKIQPFVTAGAGLLIFGRKIPDDRSPLRPNQVGRRLNFTPQGGGGVEFLTDDGQRSYTVGFKIHHISNNSTGNINPGFDQNLFYFGYTFKKF